MRRSANICATFQKSGFMSHRYAKAQRQKLGLGVCDRATYASEFSRKSIGVADNHLRDDKRRHDATHYNITLVTLNDDDATIQHRVVWPCTTTHLCALLFCVLHHPHWPFNRVSVCVNVSARSTRRAVHTKSENAIYAWRCCFSSPTTAHDFETISTRALICNQRVCGCAALVCRIWVKSTRPSVESATADMRTGGWPYMQIHFPVLHESDKASSKLKYF